nr:heavy metal-associated isoprenylated plant protein 7-like [Ipomoea batatas]
MHCEGCARKVRRCLKDFDGRTHKVVVKGEKADPVKVLERVQKKSHRQVELLSPIPAPAPAPEEEPKKPPEEVAKPEEKKEEVITVVLKAHMHCEACAEAIKKRILRMKEDPKMEMKKHELYYSYYPPIQVNNNPHYHHHQRFAAQDGGYGYGYPQMFSDENPNACSVM